jgi:pimeloyl-ACP methyl ester carboxylesterase
MLRALGLTSLVAVLGGAAALYQQAPRLAAGALLHPVRTVSAARAPDGCAERDFAGDGLVLRGWDCGGTDRRETVIYLHGIADNHGSGAGAVRRFASRGYRSIAYDSRAHGRSGGDVCTYGFFEKNDLQRVLEVTEARRAILIGTSLGAAVALQAAAEDPRIAGVVAAEVFADLETVARERAPFFVWEGLIQDAFASAEQRGRFRVADVSPELAARRIRVPVLLVHGAADTDTPPAHSQRVFAALAGPKQLILVPNARHNESLHDPATWQAIDRWIDTVMRGTS